MEWRDKTSKKIMEFVDRMNPIRKDIFDGTKWECIHIGLHGTIHTLYNKETDEIKIVKNPIIVYPINKDRVPF